MARPTYARTRSNRRVRRVLEGDRFVGRPNPPWGRRRSDDPPARPGPYPPGALRHPPAGRRSLLPTSDSGLLPELAISEYMVLVKGGTFDMGEVENSHQVTLSDFLIAKHLLTFDEYDAFCKATGRKLPNDMKWGSGTRPVINVSWFDAVD